MSNGEAKCMEENRTFLEIENGTQKNERELWSRKIEGMLSFIGLGVGLGNLWRFPYLCMRNGGGAFLIPFLLCLTTCGLPLYFLELSLAQFTGKETLHAWEACPIFRGLGMGMVVATILMLFYYNVIISWSLYYLGNAFINPLPWISCNNSWNTEYCVTQRTSNGTTSVWGKGSGNISHLNNKSIDILSLNSSQKNLTDIPFKYLTSEEEFWQFKALKISSGIENLGGIQWHMAVCFLAGWIIVFFCLIRGIKSLGKVVYVTATLPYILITVILVRALFLPGSSDGILLYITPDFQKLRNHQVWIEASLQVFYSLCPAWGQLLTLASYNKFDNNCYRDSIVLTFISEGTSIYGGFAVFAVLGHMAHEANLPIATVAKSGPGLGFVVYPEALSTLPLPNLWAVLFFVMLFSVGLDSEFALMEVLISAFKAHFPKMSKRHVLVTSVFCAAFFLAGLIFCTRGGIFVYQLVDWYVAIPIPVFGLIECLIFGWIYGAQRFSMDIEMMIGRPVPIFIRVCWCIVIPVLLAVLFLFTLVSYQPPTYGVYEYPLYANVLGWAIGILPFIPVIVIGVTTVIASPGDTVFQKIKSSLKPSKDWKPVDKKYALDYNADKNVSSLTLSQQIKLNLLGKSEHYMYDNSCDIDRYE